MFTQNNSTDKSGSKERNEALEKTNQLKKKVQNLEEVEAAIQKLGEELGLMKKEGNKDYFSKLIEHNKMCMNYENEKKKIDEELEEELETSKMEEKMRDLKKEKAAIQKLEEELNLMTKEADGNKNHSLDYEIYFSKLRKCNDMYMHYDSEKEKIKKRIAATKLEKKMQNLEKAEAEIQKLKEELNLMEKEGNDSYLLKLREHNHKRINYQNELKEAIVSSAKCFQHDVKGVHRHDSSDTPNTSFSGLLFPKFMSTGLPGNPIADKMGNRPDSSIGNRASKAEVDKAKAKFYKAKAEFEKFEKKSENVQPDIASNFNATMKMTMLEATYSYENFPGADYPSKHLPYESPSLPTFTQPDEKPSNELIVQPEKLETSFLNLAKKPKIQPNFHISDSGSVTPARLDASDPEGSFIILGFENYSGSDSDSAN